MNRRFVRYATFLPILGVALVHLSTSEVTAAPERAAVVLDEDSRLPAPDHVALPEGVEAFVAGDMVVQWIDDPAAPAPELVPTPGVPVDLTVGPEEGAGDDTGLGDEGGHEAARADGSTDPVERHAGASGGYALFSPTARWVPGGYTIRLTGSDGRIEQYRDELTEAARIATATTGVPIRVAPGLGGPVDPGRGEIAVVVGSGPCGAGSIGCGGPMLTTREVAAGRVWIHASGLGVSAPQRTNLAAHELGHALGLQHYDDSWTDGRQIMYPTLTGTTSYRTGDSAGLRLLARPADRPAGTLTSGTYAAGAAHLAGTVTSGSRVRLSAGSVVAEVPVAGGRFSGSLPLPAGSHQVCATSVDPASGFRPALGCVSVTAPGAPVGRLDPLQGSPATIRITGWALDPQTAGAVQVQITRNGAVVATVRADRHRDDLGGAATRYGTRHGFEASITPEPGRNVVCARIIGIGAGGDADAGCAELHHTAPPAETPATIPAVPDVTPRTPLPLAPVVETTTTALTGVVGEVLTGVTEGLTGPSGLLGGVRTVLGG